MKKIKKPIFFVVLVVLLVFSATTFWGVRSYYGDIETKYVKDINDIRLGIDIKGGVDVTFTPKENEDGTVADATPEQLDSVKEIMKTRLANLGINDSEVYVDTDNARVIVRFPWQAGEADFDPESAVSELGDTAQLTFRKGTSSDVDDDGNPTGELILKGNTVTESYVAKPQDEYLVALKFNEEGTKAFGEATTELAASSGYISIWMDKICVSQATVSTAITGGEATIEGKFDYNSAKSLSDKINAGALPFDLTTSSFKTISPTLGDNALKSMILGGIISFCIIALFMLFYYRLPGFVAIFCLMGQVAGTLAAVSGYFSFMNSATLTIPGIAGIILSIGMGVDANIITAERIKEELRAGKRLEKALESGYERASAAIIDGNLTVVVVAIVLMGAFGVPDSLFAKMLSFVFRWFGTTTEGTIYSFGFTLMAGVILNFLMGVLASKLMLGAISKFKIFKNTKLYGGTSK